MMMFRFFVFIFTVVIHLQAYSWNAIGHRLVAQIAYDNLTPEAKEMVNKYNRSLDSHNRFSNFIFAATWLDMIRSRDVHWYDHLHYMDIPFSLDDTPLPSISEVNALWAIKESLKTLSSKYSSIKDKGLSLRILVHVVGDVHQPMHTVSQISIKYPQGDLGGNLYPLGKNPIGANLHQYWDNGAGLLKKRSKKFRVANKAKQLEEKWPCNQSELTQNPYQWILESNKLAVSKAYAIQKGAVPDKKYQRRSQKLVERQIVFAGCRLAILLNSLSASK